MSFQVVIMTAALVAAGSALPVDLPVTSVTSEGDMSSVSWASQEVTSTPTLKIDHSAHQPSTPAHQPSTPAPKLAGAVVMRLKIVTARSLVALETALHTVCASLPPVLGDDIWKMAASWSDDTLTFVKSADARVYRLVRRDWRELKDQCADSHASLSQQQQVAMQDALSRLNALTSLLEQYLQPGSTEEEARTRQIPLSDLTQVRVELALKLASYVQHLKALRAGLDSWTQG